MGRQSSICLSGVKVVPLPDLIEIVPLDKPVRAEITVPGSKSITNRALILAALTNGQTTLQGALWSEDTQVMVEALKKLGFEVKVEADPVEFCNRTITVKGLGGKIPNAGTEEKPLEIFVGNAGTAARFLTAFVCLGKGVYRLDGVPRMRERPQAALFDALREIGYRIESPNNKLPGVIFGTGPRAGKCKVSIDESSQFASALLLSSIVSGWDVETAGKNRDESRYVLMTSHMVKFFPQHGGQYQVEPDASSGSYFWGAGWMLVASESERALLRAELAHSLGGTEPWLSQVHVRNWPRSGLQVDADLTNLLFVDEPKIVSIGSDSVWTRACSGLPRQLSREYDLGDSIMTIAVLAPFANQAIKLTELGRLRLQETERVVAIRTELTKCGARVVEKNDTLEVFPSKLHGAEIETYNDHRMAMCFAILGLKVPGIKIKNPSCVNKTFPNFFQKLATEPPYGLGVTILDGMSKRKLGLEELFAE
jgi:3-phosphoshikimate 1-carboxyvinyltransferase